MLLNGVAAIGGFKDQVRVIMREATTVFIHTCNVHRPAPGHITRDLHVADEGRLGAHHDRAVPGRAVITGEGNERMFALQVLKSFQETYIRPKKGEDGLLSTQTRFTIVT